MIKLTGTALKRLDAFQLRLGHLKVICDAACDAGGRIDRIERAAAETLTKLVEVPESRAPSVAEYLVQKGLCPSRQLGKSESKDPSRKKRTGKTGDFRYPDLLCQSSNGVTWTVSNARSSEDPVAVWWQDFCLSDKDIKSRVGGVNTTAPAGSRTGLSHIFAWAEMIGLISRSGQASFEARLLSKLDGQSDELKSFRNPYLIGSERIILGFILLRADMDVFSRLMAGLKEADWPIKKPAAAHLFGATISALAAEAEKSPNLSARGRTKLFELLRDLRQPARRSRTDLGSTATAWHRILSRMETYVDLGILTKEHQTREHKYSNIYYPTPVLDDVVETLGKESDARNWLEYRLVSCLLGQSALDRFVPVDELRILLPTIIERANWASPVLPIEGVALGVVKILADKNRPVTIAAARQGLENFAVKRPDLARLSRGRTGDRAEFISFQQNKL